MMKNTEWGAVAYLSHSKYGINDEVRINNNSNYITGYASTDEADQSSYPGTSGTASTVTLPYNTETGYKATTTGNITGIYDMSGGAEEIMAAYSGVGKSGLTLEELEQYQNYFDLYPAQSALTASYGSWNLRILGDATGEMGPFYRYSSGWHQNWYDVSSDFVSSDFPWFIRGATYLSGLFGQFSFHRHAGESYQYTTSRLILTVK